MPFLNDAVLDKGLDELRLKAQNVHVCSAEPASFAAVAGVALGVAALTNDPIADRTGGGREVVLNAGAATYDASGTATHYAVVDTTNSVLLATNAFSASRAVNLGDAITIDPIAVGLQDAVSA